MSTKCRYADRTTTESRAMEQAPPPTRGKPGEFEADIQRQRNILQRFRNYKQQVIRERLAGTWQSMGSSPVKVRMVTRGPHPYGLLVDH